MRDWVISAVSYATGGLLGAAILAVSVLALAQAPQASIAPSPATYQIADNAR